MTRVWRFAGTHWRLVIVGAAVAPVAVSFALWLSPTTSIHDPSVLHIRGLVFSVPGEDGVSWWQRTPSVAKLASYLTARARVTVAGTSKVIRVAVVSAEFFSAIDCRIDRGRDFSRDDERGPIGAAIVSRGLWRSLGAQDAALGAMEISVRSRRFRITGVVQDAMGFPPRTEVWLAGFFGGTAAQAVSPDQSGWVARLKPAVSVATAESDLYAALAALNDRFRGSGRSFGDTIHVQPIADVIPLGADQNGDRTLRGVSAALALGLVVFAFSAGKAVRVVGRRDSAEVASQSLSSCRCRPVDVVQLVLLGAAVSTGAILATLRWSWSAHIAADSLSPSFPLAALASASVLAGVASLVTWVGLWHGDREGLIGKPGRGSRPDDRPRR